MGWAQRAAQSMVPAPDEALQQSQDVLSWSIRKNGPDSPISIKAMAEVANQLARQDRLDEELQMRENIVDALRKAARARRRVHPERGVEARDLPFHLGSTGRSRTAAGARGRGSHP